LIDQETPFSKFALKAVNRWRFTPGSIEGIPSSFLLAVPFRWESRNEG
jgi:hypothetical protein